MPQAILARTLGISPANLFEILKGKHSPNAEVALHIEELLRTNMTTVDQPKTLTAAKDLIESLRAELAQLKAGKATTLPPATVQIPPVTVTPPIAPKQPAPLPVASTPPAATNDRGTGMIFHPGPPLVDLSPADRLRVELNGEKDQAKRVAIHRKIKAIEAELLGPRPVARLHGA